MNKSIFQHLPQTEKEAIRNKNHLFRYRLETLEEEIRHPSYGFFGPESVSWRLYREPVIILGGMRAVLLQTAHPAVAQGVEDNSDFRNNLFARARRTIQALYALIFGDVARARRMATRVYSIHHIVTGTVSAETDSTWSGKPYRANDPELLSWVAATVADTSVKLYETLFQPFSDEEKARFAQEYRTAATLNGIPPQYHFQTLEELQQYVESTLSGPDIAVGQIGLDIAKLLFKNPYTPTAFDERFTVGLLPPSIRDAYQISWSAADERRHQTMLRQLRMLVRAMPASLRYVPAYHQARARVNEDLGERRYRMGHLINWMDQKFYVPLALH